MQETVMSRAVLVPYRDATRIEPYLEALRLAGIEPIPFVTNRPGSLDHVAGLLLTGGTDIDPACFGAAMDDQTEEPDRERDSIELALLSEALTRDLPVLAICRGFQLLNVHAGGTLLQHIPSGRHRKVTPDKGEPVHTVALTAGSRLSQIYGGESTLAVNSRHHQAVDKIGPGLVVSAIDPHDGIVEALENPAGRFTVGVQWHPENQAPTNSLQLRLFTALADSLRAA